MYLKALEINGFKSFAVKTKLAFEPGMTAVVGPNGCGKSNISDAIRWVLGETSAKAIRGTQMVDCIFNGTDSRKPLGMAEVSITFADCEKALGMEYHEVTVTRRVFRSGEGQYFINKTPCRLKDIQRLFMDTGIGTTSYSFLQQGRIDQILSSRPEDRREVFEEAAGITKFKNDKREALRKLEQTEANLLRLADVIREVKRQIGSLQRQAGKARRYQVLSDELRRIELFVTKRRVQSSNGDIEEIEAELTALNAKLGTLHREVEEGDQGNAVLRESLVRTEREIGAVNEAVMQAQGNLDHTREMIRFNEQRIAEYRALSERDAREIDETSRQLADKQAVLDDLTAQTEKARTEQKEATAQLAQVQAVFEEHQRQIDSARLQMQRRREESIEVEGTVSRLQNELVGIESRERATMIERERRAAEKAQLSKVATTYARRREEMEAALATLKQEVDEAEARVRELEGQRGLQTRTFAELQQRLGELRSQSAARQAQVDLLTESEEAREGFSAGSKLLLDPANPLGVADGTVLGSLASQLSASPAHRTALEVSLRAWLDAVLIADRARALEALRLLQGRREGTGRLLFADVEEAPAPATPPGAACRLLDDVTAPDGLRPLLSRLIGNVFVFASIEAMPTPVPAGLVCVTPDGALVRGEGSMEFWMPDPQATNPLARRHALGEAEKALLAIAAETETIRAEMNRVTNATAETGASIDQARRMLDAARRTLAQKEGEAQMITREAATSAERLETVSWELENLADQAQSGEERKRSIAAEIEKGRARREQITVEIGAQTRELQALEGRHTELQSSLTEHRIRCANMEHRLEQFRSRHDSVASHAAELRHAMEGRSADVRSHTSQMERLTAEVAGAQQRIADIEASLNENRARAESLRRNAEKQADELKNLESQLAVRRTELEAARDAKSDLQVRLSESRMRRQNMIDRVTGDYSITEEQLMTEPDPQWEGEAPTLDVGDTQVAELRAKIEAMGPVNLVAIEEYKELEERHAFLTQQETDLVNSKQQLMEMIRTINRTTTELFRSTFDQVNANFEVMFKRLFNGGTAKLVLVDEEDLLECGIEIIARPPGKRLQNVSLLSGGERTLTAVSLLFSIYLIKPSPFCMLDELDAALDDTNIGRFVAVLRDFVLQSQFLVITHNRQTISAANILYGVTMPEKGISRIVSMRFRRAGEPAEPAAGAAPAPTDAGKEAAAPPAEAIPGDAPPADAEAELKAAGEAPPVATEEAPAEAPAE